MNAALVYIVLLLIPLRTLQDALGTDDKKFQTAYADEAKGREKRRSDKVARDKQFHGESDAHH